MKKSNSQKCCRAICLVVFLHLGYANSALVAEKTNDVKPVAWWTFNSCNSGITADEVSKVEDSIQGNFKLVSGTDGRALKLDGFTTRITRKSDMVPALGDSFAFEAWIAAATYPWNWCPILAQEKNKKTGFYFGVGPQGQAGIFASVNGVWQGCETEGTIPLKKWVHLAATFDKNTGFGIYINGELSGQLDVEGKPVFSGNRSVDRHEQ